MCRAVPAVVHRSPGLLYGSCQACGHGILLKGAADSSVYSTADYYNRQNAAGAGYPRYLAEQAYRETRGRQILQKFFAQMPYRPALVLEVGSSYGYTRKAAEELDCQTLGVDLNPHAVEQARALYGFDTVQGTLSNALSARQISWHSCDFVLYQFVLEHVADPIAELMSAWKALVPGGYIGLLVPSMEAAERTVFGASYRSLRADHFHLFSRESLDRCLRASDFEWVHGETYCTVHLLSGFMDCRELDELYERGLGPDWMVLAKRRS
jgi:SAM-dependent methyltransferase